MIEQESVPSPAEVEEMRVELEKALTRVAEQHEVWPDTEPETWTAAEVVALDALIEDMARYDEAEQHWVLTREGKRVLKKVRQ